MKKFVRKTYANQMIMDFWIEHIKVYAVEAWHYEVYDLEKPKPGDASILESIGHKKVNAISTIEAGKSFIATDMKAMRTFLM